VVHKCWLINSDYDKKFWIWGLEVHASSYNSNKSPTRCNNFPVYYPVVYLWLNMFWAFSRPSSEAQCLQWQPLVLPLYHGDSHTVFMVGLVSPADWLDNEHSTAITTI
jgi:hypothetical protein